MKLSVKKYAQALADSLKESKVEEVNTRIKNFLKFLQSKKKNKILKRFESVFKEVWNEKNGVMEVKLTLPYEPSESEIENLAGLFGKSFGKKIVIKANTDKKVIGGMKLEFGEYVIDGTVAKNLELLKLKLVSNN